MNEDLAKMFGGRVANSLMRWGKLTSVEDLAHLADGDLWCIANIGKVAIARIRAVYPYVGPREEKEREAVIDTKETYEGWSILELMGHRKLGGYVREQEIAGHGFLRIDIPGPTGPDGAATAAATQFYSPASVYAITPTTEAMARAVAVRYQPEPVTRWELPEPATHRTTDAREPYVAQYGESGRDDEEDRDDDTDPERF